MSASTQQQPPAEELNWLSRKIKAIAEALRTNSKLRLVLAVVALIILVIMGWASWDYIAEWGKNLPIAGWILLLTSGFVVLQWKLLNVITSFNDDEEIVDRGNWSYMLQRIALSTALVIGLLPAMIDFDKGHFIDSTGWFVMKGVWVVGALVVSRLIVDFVILPGINNVELMRQRVLSVGIIEACAYIGLGFLLKGSLTGGAGNGTTNLLSTVGFYFLGVGVLVLVGILHEACTPYNIREGIRRNHLPSAIETGAALVANGIVISSAVAGDFVGWSDSFAKFGATVVLSVPLTYVFRWAIDKFILTTCDVKSIQEKNLVVAATVLGTLMVLMAFATATVVWHQL